MKTIAAEIRFAEPADAAALAGVHADSWQNAYGGLIPFKALRQMVSRRGTDWWRRAIARRAAILVLEFDGRTAGYATLGHNRSQALPVEGEIYEIYLRPEFQGLGFGRRLFEAAGALLKDRGLKGFAVWALADNETAVDFYTGLGGADVAEGEESFDGKTLRKVAFIWR